MIKKWLNSKWIDRTMIPLICLSLGSGVILSLVRWYDAGGMVGSLWLKVACLEFVILVMFIGVELRERLENHRWDVTRYATDHALSSSTETNKNLLHALQFLQRYRNENHELRGELEKLRSEMRERDTSERE